MSVEEIQNYLRILEAVPTNVPAFEALKRIYTENQRWEELAQLVEDRAERLPDRSQAPPLYLQAANTWFHKEQDAERAKKAITKVLELIPNERNALALWRELATFEGDFATAIKILRQEIQITEDAREKSKRFVDIAKIFEDHMDNQEHAAMAYHQAFLQDPDNLVPMEQALRLYRSRNDWQRVIAVLRARLEKVSEASDKARLMFQIGQIFIQHLDEGKTPEGLAKAAQLFREALNLDPNLDDFDNALELYKDNKEWSQVTALLRAKLDVTTENNKKARLLLELGNVVLQHLEEGQTPEGQQKAAQFFQKALEFDPELNDAKEAIEELSYATEDWSSLLKRLKKDIRDAGKDADRAAFLNYKIAEGYLLREEKPAYAVRYCKQALELQPNHTKSQDLLQRLYADLERWEALADFFNDCTKSALETPGKVKWLKKLARLYREQTKERDREIETLERILEILPTERETLQNLESIYRDNGQYSRALEVMDKRLKTFEEPAAKKTLLYEMATLANKELQDSTRAAGYFERILSLDPDEMDAIDALLPLYEAEARWENLIQGLQQKLKRTEDRHLRATMLTRVGDIYAQRLALSKEAFDSYTQALRENPQDNDLTQKLEYLARQMGNWEEMVELYRNTLESANDPADQAALYFRIGETYERELQNIEQAKASYEEARERAPHLEAMNALQRLYRQSEDWTSLAELLQEKSQNDKLDEEQRIEVFEELARIQLNYIDDAEGAAETYEKLLDTSPSYGPALEALERVYKQNENWDKLRGVYQRRVDNPNSESELKSTLHILGSLLIEQLDAFEEAVQVYQQLRVLDPNDLSILTRLEGLYRDLGQWEQWVDTARQRAESIRRPEQKKEVLLEIAKIQEEELDDSAGAISVLRELHEIDSQDIKILDELERLLEMEDDKSGQLEILRKKVNLQQNTDEKKVLLFRIADLHRALDNESDMSEAYREILDIDPRDLRSLRSLQAYNQLQGDHETVLDLLLRERDIVTEEEDRNRLTQRIAQLQASLGRYEDAIIEYRLILAQNNEDAQARTALEEIATKHAGWRVEALQVLEPIYRAAHDWEALVKALEARFQVVHDKAQRLDMARELEEIYRRLSDDEKAFYWSCQLLREDFADAEMRERVEMMADEMERWDELLVVYEDIVRSFVDRQQIVETYLFIARNYQDRLSQPENALRNYRRVLDYDSNNPEAIDALEELYRALGQWRDLIDILRMRVEMTVEVDEKKELLFEVADLWEEKLQDPPEAIQVFNDILELQSNNLTAIRRLAALYERESRYTDLAETWEKEVSLLDNEEELLSLRFNLGQLYADHLNRIEDSLKMMQQVLEVDPEHKEAIQRVHDLREEDAYRLICARILEPIYLHQENYPELKAIYKIQLEDASQNANDRRKALMRLGQLHEEKLGEFREAFDRYLQVFKETPGQHGTRKALLRMSEKLDVWRELALNFENGVDAVEDADEKIQTHLDLARIYRERLNDPDRGMNHDRRVVDDLDSKNLQAIEALEDFYQERENWQSLIDILFQKEQALHDEVLKKGVFNQIANIYENQLSDKYQAILILRQYLSRLETQDPGPAPVEIALREAKERETKLQQDNQELVDAVEMARDQLSGLEKQAEEAKAALTEYRQIIADSMRTPEEDAEVERTEAALQQAEATLAKVEEAAASRIAEANALAAELQSLEESAEPDVDAIAVKTGEVADATEAAEAADHQLEEARYIAQAARTAYEDAQTAKAAASAAGPDPDQASELQRLESMHRMIQQAQEAKAAELREMEEQLDQAEVNEAEAAEAVRAAEQQMEAAAEQIQTILEQRTAFKLDTIQELARLFEEEERWADLVDILEKEVELLTDPEEALRLRFRVAQLWQDQLHDIPRAIRLYREILNDDPDFEAALQVMEELSENEDYQLMVAESLESYFREGRQDWTRLIEMVEIQLNHTEGSEKRLSFLKEIVALYELELDNTDMAFVYLCRAFREAPTDRDVISELERLAEENDAWEELVGVYEDKVEDIGDIQLALRMYLKIANIYDEALQDPEEAIKNYCNALKLDEHNNVALNALDRLYRQERQWEELVDVLQRKVHVSAESREQVTLLSRVAQIWERELENAAEAIGAYRRILEVDGENASALSSLQRLYEEDGQWENLFEICQRKVGLVDSASERAKLTKQMALICSQQLGRTAEAIELYESVLASFERDEESLSALHILYEQTERWDALVNIVQRLLKVVSGVEKKKDFYRTLGRTYGERLFEEEKAIEGWQKVLELDPKDRDGLEALQQIYANREEWQNLVGILRRLIPLQTEPAQTLEIYLRLASIYQEKMNRLEDAIASWRRVLEIDPTHWHALDTLENLLIERNDWRAVLGILEKKEAVVEDNFSKIELLMRAAQICQERLREVNRSTPYYERILEFDPTYLQAVEALESIYTRNQDWKKLVNIFNIEVNLFEEKSQKLEKLKSIAELYENRLFNKAESFNTLLRAFQIDPEQDEIRTRLERIADETDRWNDLVGVFAQEIDRIEFFDTKIALLMRIGHIYHVELRESEPAIVAYQKIMVIDENHRPSIEALEELYDETERWPELIAIYNKKLLITHEIEEQKDLLFRIAELQEYQQGDRVAAIEAYRQIQALDPTDRAALEALEKLYREEQRWPELIDVLDRRIQQSTDQKQIFRMKFEVGSIYANKLEELSLAVDAYRDVLGMDPNNLEAMHALERLYTDLEDWNSLLQILHRELEISTRPEEKVPLYGRMGLIWEEELGQPSRAIECLVYILEVDRWNIGAIKDLERLYRQAQEWQRLIEIYEQHIRAINDLEEMAMLYYEVGSIYETYMGDVDKATTYYLRVLDADPYYQPALSSLGKIYESVGNWPKCIEMMEREAKVANEPERLVEVYFSIGKIYEERLVQIDRAKDSYRKALEIQPNYLPALRALKVIHFLQRDWEGVIRLAHMQEQFTETPEEKAIIFCEIGKISRERLSNVPNAIQSYAQALHLVPGYLNAAKPLAELYIEAKQWAEAEQVLDIVVQVLQQNELSEDLYLWYYQLALAAEKQDNIQKALYYYQESYNLNPTHFPTLNGLGRIYYSKQEWDRSLKVYQTILYHHRTQLSERDLSEVYYRMGLAFDQMQQPEQAIEYYEQALEIDPANPLVLRRLSQYAEYQQDWERTLELKERLLLVLEEEEERYQLNIELGTLCQERLGRLHQAVDFFRQAFSLKPEDLNLLYKLLGLYQETEQWYEMIETLEILIQATQELEQQLQYVYQIAEIYQARLQDVENAVAYYNKALDMHPGYDAAFQALEQLLFHIEDWARLDENYRQMLRRLPQDDSQPERKLEIWRKLGELYRYKLNNLDNAVMAYEIVYKLDPTVPNLEILADLYGQSESYRPKAVEIHHKLLLQNPARIESYKSLIRLYYELQQYDRSFAVCSTLKFLRETSPEEDQFYNSMKEKAPDRITRAFREEETWRELLFHPSAKTPLADIMAILYQFCGTGFAKCTKEYKIKKTDRVDPSLFFSRTYDYVAKVLNLQPQEVYTSTLVSGLRVVNTFPPVILAGEDMFKERHPKELLFMIARQITFSRPEFIFASVLSYQEFRALLSSLFHMYNANFPLEVPQDVAQQIQGRIAKTLPADRQGQLTQLIQTCMQDPNAMNPDRFLEGIEHTANRVGFALAGDMNISSKVCEREGRDDFKVAHRAKVKELVLYSISEEYFTFRDRQGLSVKL